MTNEIETKRESKLLAWIKRDYWAIIILLVALLCCLYTMNDSMDRFNDCKEICKVEWCDFQQLNRSISSGGINLSLSFPT